MRFEQELNAVNESLSFDFRHLNCPLLLVKVKQVLKTKRSGESVKLLVTDASFYADLEKLALKYDFRIGRKWCQSSNYWEITVTLENNFPFAKHGKK